MTRGVLIVLLLLAVGALTALALDVAILWNDWRRRRRRKPAIDAFRRDYLVGQLNAVEARETVSHLGYIERYAHGTAGLNEEEEEKLAAARIVLARDNV